MVDLISCKNVQLKKNDKKIKSTHLSSKLILEANMCSSTQLTNIHNMFIKIEAVYSKQCYI